MSTSPPNPPPLMIPMKRPPLSTGGPGSAKRRKPSEQSASPSPHPLRNASFPPSDQSSGLRRASFSPTDTGSATGAGSATNSGSGRGKKRGRRSGADARSATGGSQSGVNADAGSNVLDGRASATGGAEKDEEEADDEEGDLLDTVLEGHDTNNDRDKEIEQRNLELVDMVWFLMFAYAPTVCFFQQWTPTRMRDTVFGGA